MHCPGEVQRGEVERCVQARLWNQRGRVHAKDGDAVERFALHHSLPLRESQASLEGVEVTDQVRKPVVVHVFATGIQKKKALLISSCSKCNRRTTNLHGPFILTL